MGHDSSNQALNLFNALPSQEAQNELLKCCGSKRWAQQMELRRPFAAVEELIQSAEKIWWSLDSDDWLEAFRSHPKIGEKKAAQQTSAAAVAWSGREQAGVSQASDAAMKLLAELNHRYEEKFGFIYIVCATGKSSEELLEILRRRLPNDPDRELRTAAAEQAQITKLRLSKLIESLEVG